MDEGIELALGFHAANNLVTALLVTSSWTVFQTESVLIDIPEPSLGGELFISLFILYPIFIFLMSNLFAAEATDIKNLIINKELKKYDGLTFLDAKKNQIDLNEFQGNLIILNFWATWCAPCKREMPSLEKLTFKYPEIISTIFAGIPEVIFCL
mgnify:CR=1 FL=1